GPQRAMTDVGGRAVTGGGLPAQIWRSFAERALSDVEAEDFPPPPELFLAAPPPPERTLTLTPSEGPAGTTVTVTGTGFEDCTAGWHVTVEPGGVSPPP